MKKKGDIHFEMAICSSNRMIVATGNSGASAETRSLSITGAPTCFKPRGTVCKILIGYFPALVFRCRQYSQEAMVRTMMTKALRNVERKKKSRSIEKLIQWPTEYCEEREHTASRVLA